jgi:aldehyde:ferredoxin oxidoreductase
MPDGKFKGFQLKRDTLEKMKDEYYRLRGWDVASGIPTRETLVQVGLKEVAEDLDRLGKLPLESVEEKKRQPAKSR